MYKKLLILLIFFLQCSLLCAANSYSNAAIELYNSAAGFQNQGKYEIAEGKYLQLLKIQPDFVEAKKNLAIVYQNLMDKCYSSSAYQKAINYGQKSLSYKSGDTYVFEIMAKSYDKLNDSENAVKFYKKILTAEPKNIEALHSIAQIYVKAGQFDKASGFYRQLLSINPNDSIAKQNLSYSNQQSSEKNLAASLNGLTPGGRAPKSVYRLIKPSFGTSNNTVLEMEKILDLIWSEPDGRTILETLTEKGTSININPSDSSANSTKTEKTKTFYEDGINPSLYSQTSSFEVNIPSSQIENFNNPKLSPSRRIYSLQVLIHEFGHAFVGIKNKNSENSIEEELGVSMIGYNIAHKVTTGKYLSEAQTKIYSKRTLESILSGEHRNLPAYSGFNDTIQRLGIKLPYPELYAEIP